jgi:hypothetical protein
VQKATLARTQHVTQTQHFKFTPLAKSALYFANKLSCPPPPETVMGALKINIYALKSLLAIHSNRNFLATHRTLMSTIFVLNWKNCHGNAKVDFQ